MTEKISTPRHHFPLRVRGTAHSVKVTKETPRKKPVSLDSFEDTDWFYFITQGQHYYDNSHKDSIIMTTPCRCESNASPAHGSVTT